MDRERSSVVRGPSKTLRLIVLSGLGAPTTNLGPPRSQREQRALRRSCFRPCTRARNAPTPSRFSVPNIRWHTACAGVCMTKTVVPLPSVRWVRSMIGSLPSVRWVRSSSAALRALSPMNSRCNLSPLFASPLRRGAPLVIDLAPQRSLGSLHLGPIKAAAPPSASRSTYAKARRTLPIMERTSARWERDNSPSRRRFFDIAHGSAFEVEAVLDIARCCGFDGIDDRAARALAGRVAAMTTALVRRR